MGRHRRGDGDRIDARIAQDLVEIVGDLDRRIAALHLGEKVLAQVADRDEPRARNLGEIANEVGTPIAVADDGNADHFTLRTRMTRVIRPPDIRAGGASLARPMIRAGTPATTA